MNKYTIPILIAQLGCGAVSAQAVIASAGQTSAAGDVIVSHTVGEAVIATLSNNIIVTQGYHQHELIMTTVSDPNKLMDVTIHPNPFVHQLTISGKDEIGSVEIFDAKGSIVRSIIFADHQERITMELSDLRAGQYMLRVRPKNGNSSNAYQLIKQ